MTDLVPLRPDSRRAEARPTVPPMTEAQLRQMAAGLAAAGQSMLARLLAELLDLRAAVGAVMEIDTSTFGLQARVIAAQESIRAALAPPEGGA